MLASTRKGHTQIASFSAARFTLQIKERILPTGNHQDDDGCAILFKSLKLQLAHVADSATNTRKKKVFKEEIYEDVTL